MLLKLRIFPLHDIQPSVYVLNNTAINNYMLYVLTNTRDGKTKSKILKSQ